jgi:hypothetical protein
MLAVKLINPTNKLNTNTMFDLFKKKQPIVASENKYPEVVQQIHSEFFTASDRLLAEANAILEKAASVNTEKASMLKALGFVGTKEVVELENIKTEKEKSEALAKLIQKYSFKYPNNKFITEKEVESICKKYNLVCGDVGLYKGFVPGKNLEDIRKFKERHTFPSIAILRSYDNDSEFYVNMDEYAKHDNVESFSNYISYYHIRTNRHSFQQDSSRFDGIHFYGSAVCTDGEVRGGRLTVQTLKICAPIKDMDTTGMSLKGYKLEKHIPDPVVLQPVEGGYLIITAWGDEASDPIVVNQKMN